MAWNVPATATVGQVLTAAYWNQQVRDNMKEVWRELAYVEWTATKTLNGNTEASPLDIVSAGAITYTAEPILIEFYCPWMDNDNNGNFGLSLWDASSDLGRIGYGDSSSSSGSAHGDGPACCERRLTPSAASHTYKVRGWSTAGASVVARAGAGGTGTLMPGFIRVSQRGS